MHVSNATKSVEVYQCLAKMACKIIDEEKLDVTCIDFGGGFDSRRAEKLKTKD